MNNRILEIKLDDILELICCADDYGYRNDVLFEAFSLLLTTLSDEEIENYASTFLSDESKKDGFSEEDYESSKKILLEFRNEYLRK